MKSKTDKAAEVMRTHLGMARGDARARADDLAEPIELEQCDTHHRTVPGHQGHAVMANRTLLLVVLAGVGVAAVRL